MMPSPKRHFTHYQGASHSIVSHHSLPHQNNAQSPDAINGKEGEYPFGEVKQEQDGDDGELEAEHQGGGERQEPFGELPYFNGFFVEAKHQQVEGAIHQHKKGMQLVYNRLLFIRKCRWGLGFEYAAGHVPVHPVALYDVVVIANGALELEAQKGKQGHLPSTLGNDGERATDTRIYHEIKDGIQVAASVRGVVLLPCHFTVRCIQYVFEHQETGCQQEMVRQDAPNAHDSRHQKGKREVDGGDRCIDQRTN